jgi:hypothetical protein
MAKQNEDGWTVVSAESQIVFENIGDEFIGTFMGMDRLDSGVWQAHFTKDGEDFFTNAGYDLRRKLQKVPVKALTRMKFVDELDTGQETKMRIFDVAHK